MPQYKKPGTGRDFQPGGPGGPGRPKDPPELKALKKLTKGELTLLLNRMLNSRPEELKTMKDTVLEMWLASGAVKGIEKGDYTGLITIIERLLGKPKEDDNQMRDIEHIDKRALLEKSREAIRLLEAEIAKEQIQIEGDKNE